MDVRLNYCQACLSSDRDLYPLGKLENLLQYISLWELKSSQGGICWECHHAIKKLANFRQQIQKAQKLLHSKIHNLTPLSKLTLETQSHANHYHFSHDPLENQEKCDQGKTLQENIHLGNDNDNKEIKIKEENEESLSIANENHSDNEELLDEDSFDVKPTSNVYVEILDEKRVKSKTVKKKIEKESEEEVKDKFTTVVFTEEEMLKNREEKRNQPNFKKIPYKCDSCVLGFTRKDTYDLHLEKKHDENIGPHTCPVCLIRFTSQKQVDRHKTKHYVCYRCKLCKYETLEMWSALSHCRSKHVEDKVERIHCSYCVFVAKTPEELSQHTTAEHSVFCNDCGEKFKALTTLKSHIRRIHKVKREFICNMCSKTFKTKSRLESHMVSHNATIAQKLAYCALCKTQYKNIYVYRNHLKTSANHAEQSYQCVDCNKRFASKVYWKKHYNFYHLHKSQFHCDICNKVYWKKHYNFYHQHKCSIETFCNKLFISDWRLKNHRQTQHGLSRSRDHHCNVCGKQFFTLSTLKGHQLTHSEQRSFMCEDCGDTFKQRPALYTHCKLVHRGMKRRKKVA